MPPLVSIITVCRNSEKTIAHCAQSILPVLDEDVEYLVMDGASTDRTVDILQAMFEGKFNVKINSEADHGIYDAMNKGIRCASGDFLWYINSDDALIPDVLCTIISVLRKNPTVDCLYGDCEVVERNMSDEEKCIKIWRGNPDTAALKRGMICSHQAILCRRELVSKLGGFNTRLKIAADWDLLLRLYNSMAKYMYFSCVMAKFTRGGVSCARRHIWERHLVRKWNHCYNGWIDYEWIGDLKTVCHDYLTSHNIIHRKY